MDDGQDAESVFMSLGSRLSHCLDTTPLMTYRCHDPTSKRFWTLWEACTSPVKRSNWHVAMYWPFSLRKRDDCSQSGIRTSIGSGSRRLETTRSSTTIQTIEGRMFMSTTECSFGDLPIPLSKPVKLTPPPIQELRAGAVAVQRFWYGWKM